jgi:hypothetical protein
MRFASQWKSLRQWETPHTPLKELPPTFQWPYLHTLVLAHTQISSVESLGKEKSTPKLRTLILKGSQVTSVKSFKDRTSVTYLDFTQTAASKEKCPLRLWDGCENEVAY